MYANGNGNGNGHEHEQAEARAGIRLLDHHRPLTRNLGLVQAREVVEQTKMMGFHCGQEHVGS